MYANFSYSRALAYATKTVASLRATLAATNLLLMNLEGITVLHIELCEVSKEACLVTQAGAPQVCARGVRTESGLSVGCTRWPSKRKRTLAMFLPWRSQKAFMSLLSWVVRLILKKTSLLLSVTLMFRCSCCPSSGFCCIGEPLSDIMDVADE